MNPLLQLQNDAFGLLMSAESLKNVNIVLWRKLRIESEISADALVQLPRNGRSGAGIMIWMPGLKVEHQNLPSEERVLLAISVVEDPNLNATPETGTTICAEDLAILVKDIIHNQCLYGLAEIVSSPNAIVEDKDFEGLLAYKVNFELVMLRDKPARADAPVLSDNGVGYLELTNGVDTPAAEIWYTLDGTLPCNASALDPITRVTINPGSALYSEPLLVPAEPLTIRWIAYQSGFNPSNVQQATVSNPP